MIFKKENSKKNLRTLHSIQKKCIRLVNNIEKTLINETNLNYEQVSKIHFSIKDTSVILLDELNFEKKSWISQLCISYLNISTVIHSFIFISYEQGKKSEFLNFFFSNLRELLEVYESAIFHFYEHPNLAKENFGNREIFLDRINHSMEKISLEEKKENLFTLTSIILCELNNIEISIRKIIY
ncbi:MAG: hypothetical protein WC002_00985 [Candidatus Muiribacteriota bacterium]|jgi:hypothetical protein